MNCGKLNCPTRATCTDVCDDYIAINPKTEDETMENENKEIIEEEPEETPVPAVAPVDPSVESKDDSEDVEGAEENPKKKKKGKSAPGTGYCLKCKKAVTIKDGKQITAGKKNNTTMLKGVCPHCSTKVCRIIGRTKKNPAEDPVTPIEGVEENPKISKVLKGAGKKMSKVEKKVEKKAAKAKKDIMKKGAEVKKKVKKAKALPSKLRLHIVTFWKDNRQHVWVVKSATTDGAKKLVAQTVSKGKELKDVASYTLDDWIEASWRKWGTRKAIARGLSAATRKQNWNTLSTRAKAIVRRNFLLTKINKWAANPPEDWQDVEDEVAPNDEVDEGYDSSLDEVQQNPPARPPAQVPRTRVPPGYLIEKEDPSPDDLASCKHCGGSVIHSGKLAKNPKGGKVFWLLGCEDCGAKYKLVEN